jgi:peptide-methionine (S)-S-oxide reductase
MKRIEGNTSQAIFAAGCFWGVQAVFDSINGVVETVVGYTGGKEGFSNPSYELVCSGKTGHAEAIQVTFDPRKISYKALLEIFWMNHDPTSLNKQGSDIGEQYRSAIFYLDDNQKMQAVRSMKEYQKKMEKKIVTEISTAGEFYPAEKYHQKYYQKHAINGHINLPSQVHEATIRR